MTLPTESVTLMVDPALECVVYDCSNLSSIATAYPDERNPGSWIITPMCQDCVRKTLAHYTTPDN